MALEKPFLRGCCLMTLMSHTSWKKRQIWEQPVPAVGGYEWSPEAVSGRSTVKGWGTGPPWSQGWAQHCWGCCQCTLTRCRGAQVELCSQKCSGGTERQLLSTHLDFFASSYIRQHSILHKITLFSLFLWFTIVPTTNYRHVEWFKVEKTSKIIKSSH